MNRILDNSSLKTKTVNSQIIFILTKYVSKYECACTVILKTNRKIAQYPPIIRFNVTLVR